MSFKIFGIYTQVGYRITADEGWCKRGLRSLGVRFWIAIPFLVTAPPSSCKDNPLTSSSLVLEKTRGLSHCTCTRGYKGWPWSRGPTFGSPLFLFSGNCPSFQLQR